MLTIVSIFGIATSPITQQAVGFATRSAPGAGLATIRATNHWHTRGWNMFRIRAQIGRAVSTGLSAATGSPVLHQDAECSSGECSLPTYSSLAVCVKLANVTSLLAVTRLDNTTSADWNFGPEFDSLHGLVPNGSTAYRAGLPNGISITTPLPYSISSQGGIWNQSLAFSEDANTNFTSIGRFFVIYSNAGNISLDRHDGPEEPAWTFEALEIVYHMCVNTYATLVTNGYSSTTLLGSSSVPLASPNNHGSETFICAARLGCNYIWPGPANMTLSDPESRDPTRNFSISASIAAQLGSALHSALTSYYVFKHENERVTVWHEFFAEYLDDSIYGEFHNISNSALQYQRLSAYFNSSAVALSNM